MLPAHLGTPLEPPTSTLADGTQRQVSDESVVGSGDDEDKNEAPPRTAPIPFVNTMLLSLDHSDYITPSSGSFRILQWGVSQPLGWSDMKK